MTSNLEFLFSRSKTGGGHSLIINTVSALSRMLDRENLCLAEYDTTPSFLIKAVESIVREFVGTIDLGHLRLASSSLPAKFANCLTAPSFPAFLALLLYTPPIHPPLGAGLPSPPAARLGSVPSRVRLRLGRDQGVLDWPWSWLVAGGPVGQWVGGMVLRWMELDWMGVGVGGPGIKRLGVGVMRLAYWTLQAIKKGDLNIDIERNPGGSAKRVNY
ncbi:hypothetical protein L198_07815 [Cryptococcus wingfieldii CBS 7118]|uniref:Uncharacterized protein n=1 Tax=Cryptococcus wingfieldii CBS 7118 TaxID=1295528 RepID=A0A1E3HVY2_9TREE|nr:hypothetical protein L198_07815 [Cryptococcus wingfieldii CBS 7118]ODN80315.1 hypothetical protein L198_07815 [Cryptococcus wingfieldii CBS 7118]